MRKKFRYIAAGMALALALGGCAEEQSPVSVVRADELTVAATAADRFAGVVISDNAVTVQREGEKAIKELLVAEGDQVLEGDKLFSYDTDELNLTLDKQELDMARLDAQIKDTETQIKEVEKGIEDSKKKKLDTTGAELNLRQLKATLAQAKYDKSALQTEIDYTKKMLSNVSVYSPISGTVRTIDESSSESYIVIQQTGAYRVKGMLNEMNMGMGIMEGTAVQVISRLNPDQIWNGVVELVDYENAEQNSYDQMYYGTMDTMTASSSYPFYVVLESTEGLLLGQHVYIQLAAAGAATGELYIPESYLTDFTTDPLGTITASVWVTGEDGTLVKQIVGLGEYDLNTGSYQVVSGLEKDDYVANPGDSNVAEGAEAALPNQEEQTQETSQGQENGETYEEDAADPSGDTAQTVDDSSPQENNGTEPASAATQPTTAATQPAAAATQPTTAPTQPTAGTQGTTEPSAAPTETTDVVREEFNDENSLGWG